jgi:microcystin degradation protein MlrC
MAPVRALIAAGMANAACGPIWDPQAVAFASDAGVGAQMALRIGGKSGPDAGAPLDVNVTVTGIAHDAVQKLGDAIVPVGDAVGVEANGVALLLTSLRDQAYDPDLFRAVGIEPAARDYLILKSSQQFRIGFAQMSDHVLNLPSQIDPQSRVYIARPRPLWPFEEIAS